jgi:Uma2 family endonuclease
MTLDTRKPARLRGGARRSELDEVEDLLLASAERMELTKDGWVEKVSYPLHGNVLHRLSARFIELGVPIEAVVSGSRLSKEPDGRWYIPDVFVVLPTNPVPVQRRRLYAGAPDLIVEVVSHRRDDLERDRVEKAEVYAARGVPNYWLVDPDSLRVTWLRLDGGAYQEVWTRPLAKVELPWAPSPEADSAPSG